MVAFDIKACLFDVFGTVVDWRTSVTRDLQEFARRKGIHGVDWLEVAVEWRKLYQPSMDEVRSGRRAWHHVRQRLVDGVVGTDEEVGAHLRELLCRGQHEVADPLPIRLIDTVHVIGERRRVHRHFRMCMRRAEKLRSLGTDGAVAKRRAFSGAGGDADVLRHDDDYDACNALAPPR